MEPGQERAQRLHGKLIAAARRVCRFSVLMTEWAGAAPELVGAADQTVALREALESLAEAGLVSLPKGRSSWDRSFRPALPFFVVVAGVGAGRRDDSWRNHSWRHELGWVASLRTVGDAQLAQLMAINDWLLATKGGRVPAVPRRIRSAEILGNEKALDDLAGSALFGPGRITWELLAAQRIEPPLALRRVGPRGGVLVVENADPYWLAIEAMVAAPGPVGVVAWGAGRGGSRSLPTLALEPGVTGPIWYWGDVDPAGLDIPAAASAGVAASGLGPLRPAESLYEAMADHADQVGPTEGREAWGAKDRSGWLGPALWARFEPLVRSGGRIAQEVLGPDEVLAATRTLLGPSAGTWTDVIEAGPAPPPT
ncbi:MAG: hypothetical protein QOD01_2618 [Actinomycetota bacterium]|jgi:hypothetical protein|nr:hypothetical protein [Actinomycetota bacterium]